jgi:hypothetical protein
MTARVTAFMRANPSADFTTMVLMQSYDQVRRENPEKAWVAKLTMFTFSGTLSRVCPDDTVTRISQLVQLYID